MKVSFILVGMILTFVQLPFGPSAPEKPKEEKTPVKGWWMVSYFSIPPTQYSRAGKGMIKAESLGSRSSLYKDVEEKNKKLPILAWRWKVSNIVCSAIETRKDRFDAPARVKVAFGNEQGISMFGRREPSGPKIEYIWASHLPKGHIFDHPGEKSCKIFVLESGESNAGQWIYEERNIRKDYKIAFGVEPEEVQAIGIETDTDHSNEKVTAYYSEPILKNKRR